MNFVIYNSHRGRHVPTTATSLAYSDSRASELQMPSVGGRVGAFLRLSCGAQLSCRELSLKEQHKTPPRCDDLSPFARTRCTFCITIHKLFYACRLRYILVAWEITFFLHAMRLFLRIIDL